MDAVTIFNDFVSLVDSDELPIEAVAIADGDSVIAEHHFTPDQERNIYSHTKSYVSTAIGIAVEEGILGLDDKLADAFPQYVPSDAQPELFDITLRHLLTMSSGFNHAYLMNPDRRGGVGAPDYLKYMLSRRIEVEPGSEFCYSSADSYLAGRMLEKACGERLGEYLYRTVFSRLDQGWPLWECDPQGHPTAGSGMFMKLGNMLKLGQVYLNGGTWHGERIVDESWVNAASAKQIETPHDNIWTCGYGYQFWMSPYDGAYRADGAYGQITTVLPKLGLVVAVQCPESGDFDNVMRPALHEHLFGPLTA
jgi:CubicO group peptidase (beta-lactamase class C family)